MAVETVPIWELALFLDSFTASSLIFRWIALLAFSMAVASEAYALLNAVNLLSTLSFSAVVVLPSAMAALMEAIRSEVAVLRPFLAVYRFDLAVPDRKPLMYRAVYVLSASFFVWFTVLIYLSMDFASASEMMPSEKAPSTYLFRSETAPLASFTPSMAEEAVLFASSAAFCASSE